MRVKANIQLLQDNILQNKSLVGIGNITVDRHIRVNDVKVMNGANGLFVAMPQTKYTVNGEEKWKDYVYPIDKELKEEISATVLQDFADKSKFVASTSPSIQNISAEVRPLDDKGRLKGIAKANLDGIEINDIRIIEGKNGAFASLPQYQIQNNDGTIQWENSVNINDKGKMEQFQRCVLDEYEKSKQPGYISELKTENIEFAEPIRADIHLLEKNIAEGKNLIASGSVLIGDIEIRNIGVINGKNGMFINMPQRRDASGKWNSIVNITDSALKQGIRERTMQSYHEELDDFFEISARIKDIEVNVYPNQNVGKLLGTGSICIDGLVVNDIKIVDGKNGRFVNMPQYQASDGQWQNIVLVNDSYKMNQIQEAVLEMYTTAQSGLDKQFHNDGSVQGIQEIAFHQARLEL